MKFLKSLIELISGMLSLNMGFLKNK